MQVSRIYACFAADTDRLYRSAMALAARHRIVRVHHLLRAATDGVSRAEPHELDESSLARGTASAEDDNQAASVLTPWRETLLRVIQADPAGSLDAPLTNSVAMRRVLQLAYDRRDDGPIRPAHLVAMGLSCWAEETPPGPRSDEYRLAVSQFVRSLAIAPLPTFNVGDGQDEQVRPAADVATQAAEVPAPTAKELEQLIGPAVTERDIIELQQAIDRESDTVRRAWLVYKLAYLRDRG